MKQATKKNAPQAAAAPVFYNVIHSPLGAHASFTLGCAGRKGGLGLELSGPADEDVFIGVEDRQGGTYKALPFFAGAEGEAARYDHGRKQSAAAPLLTAFREGEISRELSLCQDLWRAGDLTFAVYSPVEGVPDPEKAAPAVLRKAVCPAVLAELTIDNRAGKRARRAFFGYRLGHVNDAMLRQGCGRGTAGVGCRETAIFTDAPGAEQVTAFEPEAALRVEEPFNYEFGLGGVGMLRVTAPAGRVTTFRFAICFYRGGLVTTGIPAAYWYSRYFRDIYAVGAYALRGFAARKREILAGEKLCPPGRLNPAQYFQLCHAVHSYFASTQLLMAGRKPLWVVNEGEYRMMNTFDLLIDHAFFEMRLNPWTLRNELDLYAARYSYRDRVHFPGGDNVHPGGIAFNHDMGQRNHFSRPGRSSYELTGLSGCFSHMSHEQLVNWVLAAALYAPSDARWARRNLPRFRQCLRSLLHRDDPVAARRDGLMSLDSSRTGRGAEITTYDSLDASLGQARNNVYLGVKTWAAYLALERLLAAGGPADRRDAAAAAAQAERAAATIAAAADPRTGMIPAIVSEKCASVIIPAIEGLVFPWALGMREVFRPGGKFAPFIAALRRHCQAVLRKGVCLYPDGGWKLSSSADNSWLSKIYLCQFIAREVLGVRGPEAGEAADRAHMAWLLRPENAYYAFSDQMTSGVAMASKYYPRGVTAILWLDEAAGGRRRGK